MVDLDNEAEARAKLKELRLLASAPEVLDCLKEAQRYYDIEAQTAEKLANRSYFKQWAARFKATIDGVAGDN